MSEKNPHIRRETAPQNFIAPTHSIPFKRHDNETAQQYDKSVQPKWYERLIGAIVAFLMGRW